MMSAYGAKGGKLTIANCPFAGGQMGLLTCNSHLVDIGNDGAASLGHETLCYTVHAALAMQSP